MSVLHNYKQCEFSSYCLSYTQGILEAMSVTVPQDSLSSSWVAAVLSVVATMGGEKHRALMWLLVRGAVGKPTGKTAGKAGPTELEGPPAYGLDHFPPQTFPYRNKR